MAFQDTLAGKFFLDLGERTGWNDFAEGVQTGDLGLTTQGLNTLRGGPRPYIANDPIRDNLISSNSSYSGTDCVVIAQVNQDLIVLGNVLTCTYSIFREKSPVRTLGRSHAKAYTQGPRTIAGSMIFVVFDRHPLYEILKSLNYQDGAPQDRFSTPVADQIPPIDLILWFTNEYGHKSVLRLYGLEFLQEGQTHSINDLYTENTMQYVARDIDVLIDYKDIEGFRNLLYERQISGQVTDNHLTSMLAYKAKIERQIQDIDNEILKITQERGKRGIVTLGITEALGAFRIGNNDLRREYEKQLIVKKSLVDELSRVNNSINTYQKSGLFGYTRGNNADALMSHDDLEHENVNRT